MILLPHGCSCSEPSVNPKNWKTGGKSLLKKNWRIHYYFRDPKFKEKHPYGKLILIKGMNCYKTIDERRKATQLLIDEELYVLKVDGYNPITKSKNGPEIELVYDINPETRSIKALDIAQKRIEGEKSTLSGVKTAVKYFKLSCNQLRYDLIKICDLKRVHIKNILENQRKQNNYTNERYNKTRAYMMMVFKELVQADAIDYNPIKDIPKKKETKKIRPTLSDSEMKKVRDYLRTKHYTFYRYFEIFFRSGSRSTEMFRIKYADVDLKNQRFKVLVKKGRRNEEQWRAINNKALPYWNELMSYARINDFIFSYNFTPGSTQIAARQVSIKWRKYIKKPLGITVDFYALKHLYTTQVINLYDRKLASGVNGHKDYVMNEKHYDTLHSERLLEEAKKIDI